MTSITDLLHEWAELAQDECFINEEGEVFVTIGGIAFCVSFVHEKLRPAFIQAALQWALNKREWDWSVCHDGGAAIWHGQCNDPYETWMSHYDSTHSSTQALLYTYVRALRIQKEKEEA